MDELQERLAEACKALVGQFMMPAPPDTWGTMAAQMLEHMGVQVKSEHGTIFSLKAR